MAAELIWTDPLRKVIDEFQGIGLNPINSEVEVKHETDHVICFQKLKNKRKKYILWVFVDHGKQLWVPLNKFSPLASHEAFWFQFAFLLSWLFL